MQSLPAWLIPFLPALQAAQDAISKREADALQYIITVGIVAILALIYRLDHRVARLEQKLHDPSDGIVVQLQLTRRFRHWCRNTLFGMRYRLRAVEAAAGIQVVDEHDDFPERSR
jgi:hypothetical protein